MTGGTTVLLIIAVVVVAGGVAYFQWRIEQRRTAAFAALAAGNGWRHTARDDGFTGRYVGNPFGSGHGRSARHVVTGTHRGRDFAAFEYVYKETKGSGDNKRTVTYRNQIVGVSTPAARPTLEVSRAGLGSKLLGMVGVRDLQLESEQFNSTFRIRAEDDRFAYDVLHPRTMEWLLTDQRAAVIPFRFERSDLMTWTEGKADPHRLLWTLEFLCDVADRVPDWVWKP